MTFSEPGSLGLKFSPNAAQEVEVLAINPGTQAARHPQLKPGLVLKLVGATDVTGMPYKQVINVIKSNPGRPLAVGFSFGSGGSASDRAAAGRLAAPAPRPVPVPALTPAPAVPPPLLPPVVKVNLVLNKQYACVRRSMTRVGFSMDSEKAGIVEIGDVVTVLETRVNEANTTRVRFERGWTNATMTDGSIVFEELKRTHHHFGTS